MLIRILLMAMLWALSSAGAYAHSPGLSSLEVTIQADQLDARVTFALQDIEFFAPMDSDLDAEVSNSEREAAKPEIANLMAEQLLIRVDGQGQGQPQSEPGEVTYDDQNNAHVTLHYTVIPQRELLVQSKFLTLLPDGHQQYLTIKRQNGTTIREKMLTKQDNQISFVTSDSDTVLEKPSWFAAFTDFFKLGMEHIVTGYDHLLFLFALLAVTHSFGPALKIITYFTIAHSITLACAGLNLIEIPSSVVEPFIAVTIIYVALENIIRGDHPKGRHWLTFGFGLIHGFGFAGVLREMDISSGDTGILLPLLSFNLGIETGQIAVASIVLPMIWWLNNKIETSEKFLKGCSAAVSLMGVFWLLERTVLQ